MDVIFRQANQKHGHNIDVLTDIGDSAPRLLSRKNDAVSMDVMVNKIGFAFGEDEILIGGSADQTLPFKLRYRGKKKN